MTYSISIRSNLLFAMCAVWLPVCLDWLVTLSAASIYVQKRVQQSRWTESDLAWLTLSRIGPGCRGYYGCVLVAVAVIVCDSLPVFWVAECLPEILPR